MKRFLLFLSFLFLVSSQSFGQIDADVLIKRANGTDNTGWLAMTNDGDGTYSYSHTFPLAIGSGYFVVQIRKIDKSGAWVTTYYPLNTWHTSWVYTTSDEQTITIHFDTNDHSADTWLPTTGFCYSDEYSSWSPTTITATIVDDGNKYITMLDNGSLSNGDYVLGDNIYAGKYTTSSSIGTNFTIDMRFSSYSSADFNNARWTIFGKTQSAGSSENISVTTTSSPQDIYFYVNVNTGRVKVELDNPLPVELTTFTATSNEDGVILNWETATEVNNYGFNIERKLESQEWNKVGFVEGHGNSNSPKYYTFEDNTFEETGKYFYRLKQVDIDGTFEYSDVVEINVGLVSEFELSQNYPNPFNPTTEINFNLSADGFTTLKVFNLIGQEVSTIVNQDLTIGVHKYQFDASGLTNGIYFYQLESDGLTSVKKMILMK